MIRRATLASLIFCGTSSLWAAPPDFGRDIQPILSENCFHCHGPDAKNRQAELRLDTATDAVQSGAVVPGKSSESELIRRILSDDPDERMPPPKSHRKLSDKHKQLLKDWVDGGAHYAKHWSFAPPVRPALPETPPEARIVNPIDAFIVARLQAEGLKQSPEAEKAKLLRRVSLDLVGLPPTPEELDAFLADASPDAFERAVDRLLASPRYGERMVWEWLDAARYADTNGYQGDPTRAMWYWRDWAIGAFNRNLPFDRFTVEQLAGDLLPEPSQDQLIATGFHRNHMINGEGGRIAEESRIDYVQDRVETTGAVWLGLTLTCCRCHDHKYDPFSQKEYYSLAAYFNSLEETGRNDAGGLANPLVDLASPEEKEQLKSRREAEKSAANEREELDKRLRGEQAAWEQATLDSLAKSEGAAAVPDKVRDLLAVKVEERTEAQKKELTELYLAGNESLVKARKRANEAKTSRDKLEKSLPRTMVMRDLPQPRETFILSKGAYNVPGEKVTHGVLTGLAPLPAEAPANRLALANWLVSPEHPLASRVTVNRIWQQFFGVGLVKTAEDFGLQGDRPSHPELLDWLAVDFRESGWDVKRLVKLIVTSATYRQSSHVAPGMAERDPENRLLARGPRFRLPSWMIRDQALAASGLLVEKVGGPPVKGYQPEGIWEDATFGKITYQQDKGEALYRRSVYQFWRRIVAPAVFFDVANRQNCSVKTDRTNTPLHALVTLNDVTYVESARALAQRTLLSTKAKHDDAKLAEMFRRCTSREPYQDEIDRLARRLKVLREAYARDEAAAKQLLAVGESKPDANLAPAELAAWTGMANLVLNLDESITKE